MCKLRKAHLGVFYAFVILLVSLDSLAAVNRSLLSQETQQRFDRVPEFKFIREIAKELEVDVYLFGGSATTFAHYVRWDLEREAGDDRFYASRFDYNFSSIYRGNQDLDLVVDGSHERVKTLEERVKKKFPHFANIKKLLEIRFLNSPTGVKPPVLGDLDFLNQHTDSNSVGMIKLSPQGGGNTYKDLKDWENDDPLFLRDVAAGKISYLFNSNHEKTSRFKSGDNPPMLSAIRYLAKVSQFGLLVDRADLQLIKNIVDGTDKEDLTGYAIHRIGRFALKVLLNSFDLERSWVLLDRAGVREKLISMDEEGVSVVGSIPWWMNKKPLRSSPLGGRGLGLEADFLDFENVDQRSIAKTSSDTPGQSAGELAFNLGVDAIILSHEVKDLRAYESITGSPIGIANAFVSRPGMDGESADDFGEGLYTMVGLRGAYVHTGINVRFELDPKSIEGIDYLRIGNLVLVKNRSAISVVEQSDEGSSLVATLGLYEENEAIRLDRGVLSRIGSRLQSRSDGLEQIVELLDDLEGSGRQYNHFDDFIDIFRPFIVKLLEAKVHKLALTDYMKMYASKLLLDRDELLTEIFVEKIETQLSKKPLPKEEVLRVSKFLNSVNFANDPIPVDVISVWFKQPESADYPGILLNYLHAQKSRIDDDWKLSWVIDQSLELPHWKHHKLVKLLSGSDGISDKSIRRNLPEVLGLTKGKSSGLFDGSRAQKSCDAILREVG